MIVSIELFNREMQILKHVVELASYLLHLYQGLVEPGTAILKYWDFSEL